MFRTAIVVAILSLAAMAAVGRPAAAAAHTELAALFREWRSFQKPPRRDGVPDYGVGAMAAQHRALGSWQRRLAGASGSCRSFRPPRSEPANCRCRTDPPAGSRRP